MNRTTALVAGVFLAAGSLASGARGTVQAASPPVPSIDWSMTDRFGLDTRTINYDKQNGVTTLTPGSDGIIDYDNSDAYLHPHGYDVTLTGCSSRSGSSVRIVSYRWTVAGLPPIPANSSCATRIHVPDQGFYNATLTVTGQDGQTGTTTRKISVKDWLIVSLGDSVASGEGNPDRAQQYDSFGFVKSGPRWEDKRCDRSEFAGPAQAALQLERRDPHSSVTFLSLACSGASIARGLLGTYNGIDPPLNSNVPPLPPQVDQAAALLRTRTIDALFLSIGANDIHFADIVSACAQSFIPWQGRCQHNQGLLDRLHSDLAQLPGQYDTLGAALKQKLHYTDVYLTEYMDVTTDDGGQPAAFSGDLGGILQSESQWAHDYLIPSLNNAGNEAALRNRWVYVGNIASAFVGHGYPANSHWIRRAEESLVMQGCPARVVVCTFVDTNGTVHPNTSGQMVYANRLVQEATRQRPVATVTAPIAGGTVQAANGPLTVSGYAYDHSVHDLAWGNTSIDDVAISLDGPSPFVARLHGRPPGYGIDVAYLTQLSDRSDIGPGVEGFSANLDVSALSSGLHTLYVYAHNGARDWGTPAIVRFTLKAGTPGTVVVDGRANIFGAGHTVLPAPAGGGAGLVPPVYHFAARPNQVVTFPLVTGAVNCRSSSLFNGPDGACISGGTNINSYGGISGIVDGQSDMFLVGVFLTDSEPKDPAPPRLDFSSGGPLGEHFATISPQIGQVFFIGDGKTGTGTGILQQFKVPSNATRLYLGFADGWSVHGAPGYYDDNHGQLTATMHIAASST